MTSKERHEARYQRRKAAREKKLRKRANKYAQWDKVYGFLPLVDGFRKVSKASKDKTATKIWMANLVVNVRKIERTLYNGTWKSPGYNRFRIKERGKWRDIQSAHISEKGIQNSFSNNCYIPLISPHLIHDNGASLKGKGTKFSIDRFTKHLQDHIRKHGRRGWIFFYDFKSYFKTIDQKKSIKMSKRYVINRKLMHTYRAFTTAFGKNGLGLGSPVSQITALLYPNRIDHLIKDHFGISGYGRHMDDGYIICDDLWRLRKIVIAFYEACRELGIVPNPKKCVFVRLDQPFRFLKTRFFITRSGKIVKRYWQLSIRKERHRLRCFRRFYDMHLMTYDEILRNFHSWIMSLNRAKSFHIRLNMIQYFNQLFPEYDEYYPPKVKTRRQKVVAYIARLAKAAA